MIRHHVHVKVIYVSVCLHLRTFHKCAEKLNRSGVGDRCSADTAREEVARNAVEVIEVAKSSLDHGEQMLAIARQKAVRLASIEGRKLPRQQPPCLRLVIVRVRDEMDLDALLVAAHWHTRANND